MALVSMLWNVDWWRNDETVNLAVKNALLSWIDTEGPLTCRGDVSECVVVKVWTFSGDCVNTLHGHHDAVTCLQFDETRIISGSIDCTLRFWDLRSQCNVKVIDWKASEGHTGVVR